MSKFFLFPLTIINPNELQAACLSKNHDDDFNNSGVNKKLYLVLYYLVNQFINNLPWASNTVSHLMPGKGLTAQNI